MTDLSSYTHKWRAAPVGGHQHEGNKVNKRNRQPVSCAPCRNRKLKCDRGHPCDACTKRGDEDACVYGKSAAASTARRDESKSTMKAAERLRHLEELVKQMIGPEKGMPTPQTPPTEESQQPEGSLNRTDHGTTYTGSTHWAAILDQIQELRSTLTPTSPLDENDPAFSDPTRADSLFSAPQPPPLQVILQKSLPPRAEANRYLSTYFNSRYTIVPFIHTHQFRRQYEHFWDHQLDTSPVWISMLFSILCVADIVRRSPLSLFRTGTDIEKPHSPFLTASAQCLILSNYSKPQPHIVPALAMHCQCKYAVTLDPSQELGMIMSILARHTYAMGYHREPSLFEGQFTAFEAEMRRRCWSLLRQFDIMASFQLGLPVVLQPDSSDVREPLNLLDEDFDEDSPVLPPPRPNTEPTQILYLITKSRLMHTFSKICNHSLTFPKQPYTSVDIMNLDREILQTIATIPPCLRARSMSLSYTDSANVTMIRSNLLFLGEKARCVLHRKYMSRAPPQPTNVARPLPFSSSPPATTASPDSTASRSSPPDLAQSRLSREICIASSLRTITHFLDLHAEFQPGGQLSNDRWMLTSFTVNDFLLGLMVLCLAFSIGRKEFIANGGDPQTYLDVDAEAKAQIKALERAAPICAQYGQKAREAAVVANAVANLLEQVRPKRHGDSNESTRTPTTSSHQTPWTTNPGSFATAPASASPNTNTTAAARATSTDAPRPVTYVAPSSSEDMPNINPLSIHSGYDHKHSRIPGHDNVTNAINHDLSSLNNATAAAAASAVNFADIDMTAVGPIGQMPRLVSPPFLQPTGSAHSTATPPAYTGFPPAGGGYDSSPAMSWDYTAAGFGADAVDGSSVPAATAAPPFPDLLEGPEQIDWIMFDQFLGQFGVGSVGAGTATGTATGGVSVEPGV